MINKIIQEDIKTLLLYVCLVVFATLLAFISQTKVVISVTTDKRIKKIYRKTSWLPYAFSFLLLTFFSCFSAVGVDREAYKIIFNTVSWSDLFTSEQEIGFNLFALLIRLFTKNAFVFLIILAFLTNYFVFRGLWRFRKKISLGLAVFIYSSQYYFQSFNLMRIYFAASILIFGAYLIFEKKYLNYFFVLLVAFLFHYSIIFAICAYVIFLVLLKMRKEAFSLKVILCILAVLLLIILMKSISSLLLRFDSLPMIKRYANYLSNISFNAIGFRWLFNILPLVLCMYLSQLFKNGSVLRDFTLAYFTMTLLISLLAYSVPVIGRGTIVLNLPLIIILPLLLNKCNEERLLMGKRKEYRDLNLSCTCGMAKLRQVYLLAYACIAIYLILSMGIYLNEYFYLDGINFYSFIWDI